MTSIARYTRTIAGWLFPWILLPAAACAEDDPTAIWGKAIVTLDGREFVLDSGRDGQRPVFEGDDGWLVQCYEYYNDVHMSLGGPSEFVALRLVTTTAAERNPRYVGVQATINYQRYSGHCKGYLRGDIYRSPNKVQISAEPCDLPYVTEEGVVARLEYASFDVTHCRPLVPPEPDAGLEGGADAGADAR